AMVHEFDRLLPIRVLEHDECLALLPVEPKHDLGIQPIVRATRAAPVHQLAGLSGYDLHVAKAIFDEAALGGAAGCGVAPPAAQPFGRGERGEHCGGACVDADAMKNIGHDESPLGLDWRKGSGEDIEGMPGLQE